LTRSSERKRAEKTLIRLSLLRVNNCVTHKKYNSAVKRTAVAAAYSERYPRISSNPSVHPGNFSPDRTRSARRQRNASRTVPNPLRHPVSLKDSEAIFFIFFKIQLDICSCLVVAAFTDFRMFFLNDIIMRE